LKIFGLTESRPPALFGVPHLQIECLKINMRVIEIKMAATQSTTNKSSTVSAKKEYNENEWSRTSRNFELGSVAAKRRTYDGPAYTQSPTTDVKAQIR